jgi:hypothetical protein
MFRLKARLIAFYRYLDFRILQKKYVGSGIVVLSFFAVLLVFDYKIYWYLGFYLGILGSIINSAVLLFLCIFGASLILWGIYFDKEPIEFELKTGKPQV